MESMDRYPHQNRFLPPFGFFAGPVVWVLQVFIGYALLPGICQSGDKLGLYLVSIAAAAIVLIAGILAYRDWRRTAKLREPVNFYGKASRREFVAAAGALLSSLFFLLIVTTGIGQIFLNACPVNTIPFP